MTISWDGSEDANNYDLQVRATGESWTTINQTATSYNYTGLSGATTYEFQVRANNDFGSSAYSAIVSAETLSEPTVPGIPENVVASNITYNSFTINWNDVDDADNYDVDIRISGGSWESTNTISTSYDFSPAEANSDYEFRVRANNNVGNGEYSVVGTLTTNPIPVPETPTGLSASNITASSFTLSWNAMEFADNYDIQIRESGAAWESFSSSSTNFDYIGASAETSYEYQLRATNSSGESEYTPIQSVTTLEDSPTPEYCESYAKDTRYQYIDLVEIANMSNPSGDDGGYGDYTGLIADVNPGGSYVLNFSLAYKSRTYLSHWKIYIDFNRDGTFSKDENIVSGYAISSGTYSTNVLVPADAALGHTRMRVILKHRRGAADACQIFSQGEVEDYTINISNTTQNLATKTMALGLSLSETPPVEELKVYPNPAKDYVNLYIQGNIQSRVRITTITGKTIKLMTLNMELSLIHI